ncbi:NAD-dependent epimerase/dehydratase family protein [Myceligenerans pegani]|uniref:NAD-dependent epimerase/dehydratase family protein n=1 Tax=Myceligenerans pegani TaxID=2776917 RepID=A0ABR9N205_9MICO|nr:NAD-dependent epimerase/dehydratase family protein [Myceligenerans sp. TRM 65318]MBE1877700.1 NAD-dependent epimerase/dehydratase family protein [Myceligenerans sp. TRM 65318]MBE3019971.1 NAD-dependent epimerase/dehydratase family protein [Myceligenerans sp. TRM 65318]
MRVVVVGATGNVGTALLRALHREPRITSLLGMARRFPDRGAAPYRHAEWRPVDVAAEGAGEAMIAALAEAFRGADAVVHLAWLVQPNRERDLLRRTHVDGTRRVAEAAVRAGVPHLVVASSVGAYSPVGNNVPQDEDWPTDGIPTSHYSVDKAAQERVLDEIEAAHPDIAVARLRPALTFQGDAARSVARYFLGPLVPLRLLRHGRLPVLPLPAGIRAQAVHADDAADAYRRVILERARGAFNVAADDLLLARDLARLVDHGRLVEVPPAAARMALAAAYDARLIRTDPGWLDMAMTVPVLDSTRLRSELGWVPRRTAAEAVAELLRGMAIGQGMRSATLRPATTRPPGSSVLPLRHRGNVRIPESLDRRLLGLYLSDHFTGATAGLERMEFMAGTYRDTPFHAELAEATEQLRAERELYRDLLDRLHVPRRPHRQAAAWIGERAGRLKFNGRITRRSPMSAAFDTEFMRAAVVAKVGGWRTLRRHADEMGLDPRQLDELIDRAHGQLDMLERFHGYARERAFRNGQALGSFDVEG